MNVFINMTSHQVRNILLLKFPNTLIKRNLTIVYLKSQTCDNRFAYKQYF